MTKIIDVYRRAENLSYLYKRDHFDKRDASGDAIKYVLTDMGKLRDFILDNEMPIPLDVFDLAYQTLVDTLIKLKQSGETLEPAHIPQGLAPNIKSAENTQQFRKFLLRQMDVIQNGGLVYGKQLRKFGNYYDAFLKQLREISRTDNEEYP